MSAKDLPDRAKCDNAIPDAVKATAFARAQDGRCQFCARNDAVDIHHRRLKGMGGTSDPEIHRLSRLVALCRFCHDFAHGHRAWARESGLIVPDELDPWQVLIWIKTPNWPRHAWHHLDDGDYTTWVSDLNPPAHLPAWALAKAA